MPTGDEQDDEDENNKAGNHREDLHPTWYGGRPGLWGIGLMHLCPPAQIVQQEERTGAPSGARNGSPVEFESHPRRLTHGDCAQR